MADTEVLRGDVLVETTSNDDVTLSELGDDIGGSDTLGVADGGHAVGSDVAREGNEAAAELLELVLDAVRDLAVARKAVLEGEVTLEDLLETLAERVDELNGGWMSVTPNGQDNSRVAKYIGRPSS